MGSLVGEPTLTHRPVEHMSPQWFPLPVVGCLLMAWWALPWTWAAATSSPVAVPTCSMGEAWREAATTYRTHHAPPQLWYRTLQIFLFYSEAFLFSRVEK